MKYAAKKFLTLIITLFIVSLLAFLAFQIIPGDPTTKLLSTEATEEARAELRAQLGLDRPIPVRYWEWLTNFLRGDMGESYSYHMPVSDMLGEKLVITFLLTILSFAFTIVLSIPLGILAGSVRSGWLDGLITALDQVVMSIPAFFIGILSCFFFGIMLHIFVPGDFVSYTQDWGAFLSYLILPALSIAIPRIAMTVKMLRGAILQEMGKDYVRTARSRGGDRGGILRRHVLKNALIPVITFMAVYAGEIMTGTILIEHVFTIPGVGRAIVVIMAAWIVIVNFVADLLYQLVDPRLRLR